MAKDRFSSQKPINYHSGWKQTGSFIKPEGKVVSKEPQYRTRQQHKIILNVQSVYSEFMNDWELNFIENLAKVPYKPSDKQKEILRKIILKYDYLTDDGLRNNNSSRQMVS
jgi:hypothetical protein